MNADAQARPRDHPYVAEIEGSLPPGDVLRGPSPHINYPNGSWDNGEGFAATFDEGGYLSHDDGSSVQIGHVRTTQTWTQVTEFGAPMWRFVGYLAPGPTAPNEAAFELFAPLSFDPEKPTSIVISAFPSMVVPPPQLGGEFAYPGAGNADGLVRFDGKIVRPPPRSDYLVSWSGLAGADHHNILAGYVVPRTAGRALVFAMQRALQLERAIHRMINDRTNSPSLRPPSMPALGATDEQYPVVAAGSSFGGFVAALLPMYFPNRFHGGVSLAFSGSVVRTLGGEEAFTMLAAGLGFSVSGTAYAPKNTLEWSAYLRQLTFLGATAADYFDCSFVDRFAQGRIGRPQYFVFPDENGFHGTEWVSLLDGSREYKATGFEAAPPGQPCAHVFWSALDKACHDTFYYEFPPQLLAHASLGSPVDSLDKAPLPFLKHVLTCWTQVPTVQVQELTNTSGQDTFAHVHARGRRTARIAGRNVTPAGILTRDTTFAAASRGAGTWLGHDDAMVAHSEATGKFVYVGSADGVVTKLRVGAASQEFQIEKQSESLGYAADGLVVGQLDGQNDEVLVATYRALHRLDLDLVPRQGIPNELALPWEHTRPTHLQIVDLFGDGQKYLLYTTQHGQLVVRDKDLNLVCDYPEPAIADLVVVASQSASGNWSRPIVLHSLRGHVVKIRVHKGLFGGEYQARVLGATPPLVGTPGGLVLSGGRVDALYLDVDQPPEWGDEPPDSIEIGLIIHEIDLSTAQADNMRVVASHWFPRESGDYGNPFVVDFAKHGNDWIVMRGGKLYRVDTSGGSTQSTVSNLKSFAPAVWPLDLIIADVTGDAGQEVVLATENGQLVWFDAGAVGTPITSSNAHATPFVVATWPLAVWNGELHALDQTGRRWTIDPASGAAALQETLWLAVGSEPQDPLRKPFRGLGVMELPIGAGTGVESDDTGSVATVSGKTGQVRIQTLNRVPVGEPIGNPPFYPIMPPTWGVRHDPDADDLPLHGPCPVWSAGGRQPDDGQGREDRPRDLWRRRGNAQGRADSCW